MQLLSSGLEINVLQLCAGDLLFPGVSEVFKTLGAPKECLCLL